MEERAARAWTKSRFRHRMGNGSGRRMLRKTCHSLRNRIPIQYHVWNRVVDMEEGHLQWLRGGFVDHGERGCRRGGCSDFAVLALTMTGGNVQIVV